jgi:hypothetical protein
MGATEHSGAPPGGPFHTWQKKKELKVIVQVELIVDTALPTPKDESGIKGSKGFHLIWDWSPVAVDRIKAQDFESTCANSFLEHKKIGDKEGCEKSRAGRDEGSHLWGT